ncbi:VWA domain-containing protein [Candidatus Woesearchaeota archaeon]|nr:VWA domain-containing protein [Candidatus Woesearchaeota archaeon]
MISEEKEQEIWEKVRKFWFYAMLPKPKVATENNLDNDPAVTEEAKQLLKDPQSSPEFLTYFDKKTYVSLPHVMKHLMIKDQKELEDTVEILELHGVGHYAMISTDLLTKLVLTHNSAKALKSQGIADGFQAQELGANLSNIFEDIVDNNYIVEHGDEKGMPDNKDKICFLYDRFKQRRESDPEMKKAPRKSWDVYMRVYEKLWNLDGRWVDKKKFSEDQERAAERIHSLVKDNMYDCRNWEKRVYRFTQIIAPFVKEDGKGGKDLQIFESESSGDAKRLKQMLKQLQGMKGKKGKSSKKDDKKDGQGQDKDKKDLEKKMKQLEKEIEEKVKGLANKLGKDNKNIIQEYKELMVGSGILDSEEKANKWLYRDLAENYSVKFRPMHTVAGKAHPFTPKRWNPSDPPQSLDLQYTLQTAGRAVPGVTTSKWRYRETFGFKEGDRPPDLYIILDSSGSMTNPNQSIAPAVLAAMAAAHSAKNVGVKVAVKNFSGEDQSTKGRDTTTLDETEDIDAIDEVILTYKGGGTVLPQEDMLEWVKNPSEPKQFLLITDTGFHNFDSAFPYLKAVMDLNEKNRGAIFCIGSGYKDYVKKLEDIGCEVFYVNSQDDLFDLVIGKAKEVYEGKERDREERL